MVLALGRFFSSAKNLSRAYHHDPTLENTDDRVRRRFQSVYDLNTANWRDWFSPAEYENPWETSSSTRLSPGLDFNPADCASRHLIQVLQNFHRYENVTTAQCNVTLKRLLEYTEGQPAVADRAKAILENMEFLDDMHPANDKVQRIARAIPRPDRVTYNIVLQIYAKTQGTVEVPEQALSIVERMEKRYDRHQQLDMKPNGFHWNCVLIAYKECDHWQRAVYALKVLLSHHGEMDSSSYVHLLQLCAYYKNNSSDPKMAHLGANVAIRLFQEMFEKKEIAIPIAMLPSHFYAFFLQAIRPLQPGSRLRDQYFDACFSLACQEGKINQYILKDFVIHAKSPVVFDRHLGRFRRDVFGMSLDSTVRKLLSIMPESWIQNAD